MSVMCVLEVTSAKDIKDLSLYANEAEWILMPGATFTVGTPIKESLDKYGDPPPGAPPATECYTVHLKQTEIAWVKRGVRVPARCGSAGPVGRADQSAFESTLLASSRSGAPAGNPLVVAGQIPLGPRRSPTIERIRFQLQRSSFRRTVGSTARRSRPLSKIGPRIVFHPAFLVEDHHVAVLKPIARSAARPSCTNV